MALYRQPGGDRFAVRGHDHHFGNGGADQIGAPGGRAPQKLGRVRRFGRSEKSWKVSISSVIVILCLALVVTVFAYNFIAGEREYEGLQGQDNEKNKNNMDFISRTTRTKRYKVLKFGRGSVHHGRDSRYWDRDDRRRDKEYDESILYNDLNEKPPIKDQKVEDHKSERKKYLSGDTQKHQQDLRSTGLYNEAGRDELKLYEEEYESSLKKIGQTRIDNNKEHTLAGDTDKDLRHEGTDPFDEYDDGIDFQDSHVEESEDEIIENKNGLDIKNGLAGDSSQASVTKSSITELNTRQRSLTEGESTKGSVSEKKLDSKRKGKRRKSSSSSCEIKFLNSTAQLVEPLESRKFTRFFLQYNEVEDRPLGVETWEPRFAGHQSIQEREESFRARDQKINCGFVRGPVGSLSTGFDLAEDDVNFMHSCHVAVSSCIFGNSDHLRTPTNKVVSRLSRKNVCFVMFVDEITLRTLSSEGQTPDRSGFIGFWKIVVVKNLPYDDMRRVGKVPKFLTHRLFPSARYSIWLDSKLRLQSDPLLILEYFLWRKNYEYAISNHYDRHCVWEEVAQNKKLNKFNHTIIDQQFEFYQADGLKKFDPSDSNKLLPSYVPEGSFIVRAHTPMSNLFSCLWFNEVDRFTPRDQLSFAYTYLKLRKMNPEKPFYLNMFKDCERRAIAKLFHHRPEDKRNLLLQSAE